MNRPLGFTIVNFLAFQAGWFACVLGAANGLPWLGPLVVAGVLLLHVVIVHNARQELQLAAAALATGLVFDSLLLTSGWVAYPSGVFIYGLAPVWILAMWVLFATTLNASMGWLKGKPVLAAVLGGVFGPLSYLAGQRLGAIALVDTTAALTALTIGWALAMPFLMSVAARFNGVDRGAPGIGVQPGVAE